VEIKKKILTKRIKKASQTKREKKINSEVVSSVKVGGKVSPPHRE